MSTIFPQYSLHPYRLRSIAPIRCFMEQSRRKIAALFSIRQRHVHIPGVAWRANILCLSYRFLGIPLNACARCTNTRLRTTHAISFPIAHVVHLSATGLLELRLLVSSLAVASTLASRLGTNTAYPFSNHNHGCSPPETIYHAANAPYFVDTW